jgi:hypothetical protein
LSVVILSLIASLLRTAEQCKAKKVEIRVALLHVPRFPTNYVNPVLDPHASNLIFSSQILARASTAAMDHLPQDHATSPAVDVHAQLQISTLRILAGVLRPTIDDLSYD